MIDMHVHLYPDAMAERMLTVLSKTASVSVHTDGTAAGTREKFREWGISCGVAMNITVSGRSMHKINDFAAEIQGNGILCFGSVHPEAKGVSSEVRRIKELGLYGVKLHPVYQGFAADDPRMTDIYEEIERCGLPVTFHAGFDPAAPESDFASSARIAQVAKGFPKLRIIAAHLGGLNRWDEMERTLLSRENVYFDTAMLADCWKGGKDKLASVIRAHGIEKVLFGSDCPYSSPEKEAAFLRESGLTEEELSYIFEVNAMKLLGQGKEPRE